MNQQQQFQSGGQERIIEAIDNPAYDGGDNQIASESESDPGDGNFVPVKVTHNPYYAS